MCMLKWYNKGIIVAHTNQQVPHFLPPHQQPIAPHLIQQAPSPIQKQPEQTKDIVKLVALLTELNKKYQKIKPSCSTSPPSLPPNMDSDIALRGRRIALEAQSAMRVGVSGKRLERFILDILETERKNIAANTPLSSASASSSRVNISCSPTSNEMKTAASTTAAANASTPTVSSPLAKSTALSPAQKKHMEPLDAIHKAPTSSPKVSSSTAARKRKQLPTFAISPFLRTKDEKIKLPAKRHIKKEGCSTQRRSYPVVEPMEGYDAAIRRMIAKMKNEKNSSSDPWSISS